MSDFELSAAEFRALYDRVKQMSRWGIRYRTSPPPSEGDVAAGAWLTLGG